MTAGRGVDLERLIAVILRAGVALSSCGLGAGLLLTLTGTAPATAAILLTAGILVLFATPVARVVASLVAYVAARDWTFALLTAVVLLELAAGVAAALHGRRL
jgi:uncharacterized membrane protein